MPAIRKKTSNRAKTNDRAKLRHKISDGRKKNRKLAKKNTQWKSRVQKDPGIPNNLPFKDQILAEIADQRRLDAEAKEAKKGSKKKSKTTPANEDDASDDGEPSLGVNTIYTGQALVAPKKKKIVVEDLSDEEEDELLLMDPTIPDLRSSFAAADIWLYVLDARDPLAHRSSFIENLAKDMKKSVVFVLNKIDTVPKEAVASWLIHLRQTFPTFPFRVSSAQLPPLDEEAKGKSKLSESDALGSETLLQHLATYGTDSSRTVTVIGAPNSGKSSVVNSLLGRSRLATYRPESAKSATTTPYPQPISFTSPSGTAYRFIDTPGLQTTNGTPSTLSDTLLRSRGRLEKMSHPEEAAHELILRATPEDLMLQYNTPAFDTKNPSSFLSGHARATGRIKKGGILDLTDSARSILRDWRTRKFAFYTLPSSPQPPSADSTMSTESDASVLDALRTKKELRTGGGLVLLKSGTIDERPIELDAPPPAPESVSVEEEAVDEEDEEDEDKEDPEDDDDEDNNSTSSTSTQSVSPPPPPSRRSSLKRRAFPTPPATATTKRKRTEAPEPTDPTPTPVEVAPKKAKSGRRVSFAAVEAEAAEEVEPTPKGKGKARKAAASVQVQAKSKDTPTTKSTSKTALSSAKAKSAVKKGSAAKSASSTAQSGTATAVASDGSGEAYDFKQFF